MTKLIGLSGLSVVVVVLSTSMQQCAGGDVRPSDGPTSRIKGTPRDPRRGAGGDRHALGSQQHPTHVRHGMGDVRRGSNGSSATGWRPTCCPSGGSLSKSAPGHACIAGLLLPARGANSTRERPRSSRQPPHSSTAYLADPAHARGGAPGPVAPHAQSASDGVLRFDQSVKATMPFARLTLAPTSAKALSQSRLVPWPERTNPSAGMAALPVPSTTLVILPSTTVTSTP
jgi:hypothetical protein